MSDVFERGGWGEEGKRDREREKEIKRERDREH